jgi:hypothetical protein
LYANANNKKVAAFCRANGENRNEQFLTNSPIKNNDRKLLVGILSSCIIIRKLVIEEKGCVHREKTYAILISVLLLVGILALSGVAEGLRKAAAPEKVLGRNRSRVCSL